jgi:hypothetical protein
MKASAPRALEIGTHASAAKWQRLTMSALQWRLNTNLFNTARLRLQMPLIVVNRLPERIIKIDDALLN